MSGLICNACANATMGEYMARGEYPPKVIATLDREDGPWLVFRCPAGHETKVDKHSYKHKEYVLEKSKIRRSEDRIAKL